MDVPWLTVLFALWEPWHLMLETLTFIPQTLIAVVGHGHLSVLTHWHAFQDAWFANVWAVLGPRFVEGGAPPVRELLSRAHGVVLDIGPGAGNWVHLYPNANAKAIRKDGVGAGGSAAASPSSSTSSTTTTTTAVTKIYGIEPNLQHHASPQRKAKEAGLDGVYKVVGAGAEELGRLGLGIGTGTVDTVVTTQVMCSVPGPERLVTELYGYLKPGGVWILYEHVKTKETGWVEWYQGFVNLFWPYCFGGCSLTRSTDEMLKQAGEWEEIKIKPLDGQNAYVPIPGVLGYLVKKEKKNQKGGLCTCSMDSCMAGERCCKTR